MSKTDTEIENFIADFFKLIFDFLKDIFLGIFRGIQKLTSKKTIIPFLFCLLLSALTWYFRTSIKQFSYSDTTKNTFFFIVLLLPVIYIFILGIAGNNHASKYDSIFTALDFKGRDKKFPAFCGSSKSGQKEYITFKSNIPLGDWKRNKELLETGLNCNILRIENGRAKNIIRLTAVPASCVIPALIHWDDSLMSLKEGTIVLGISALKKISFDLNRTPHVLFAGETGSGKSVLLRNCLWQLINQSARVFMFDFKGGVEFGKQYEQYGEVVIKRERALEVLELLVEENQVRLELFRELGVKNLPEYNRKNGKNLCRIGVFCDEIAEMLDKKGASKTDKVLLEKLEGRISTLARLSRATGINLFFGVQRPDANVLTGQIKNNIPVRISGRFADKAASEIVLGTSDATNLPDIKGRFLFKLGNETVEFQSYFFKDEHLKPIPYQVGSMLSRSMQLDVITEPALRRASAHSQASKAPKQNFTESRAAPDSQAFPDMDLSTNDWEEKLHEMDGYDLNLDFSK